jgi:hypothetical protein
MSGHCVTRSTKQVLAVMLVATAMCADRGLAAPAGRAPIEVPVAKASSASRWIDKLSRGFSRSVAVVLPRQDGRAGRFATVVVASPAPSPAHPVHLPVTPFQFRLPPPVI